MTDLQDKYAALKIALRDLRAAALPALLAHKTGMDLGSEYGSELERALAQAKKVLE